VVADRIGFLWGNRWVGVTLISVSRLSPENAHEKIFVTGSDVSEKISNFKDTHIYAKSLLNRGEKVIKVVVSL
jgi:hypothetical protein